MNEVLQEFLLLSSVWGALLTMAAFALGVLVNRKTGLALFNPLLVAALSLMLFLSLCRIPCAEYQVSAAPISFLLLPATVSLAVPLYEKWSLLRQNAPAILAGIAVGVVVSAGCIILLAWVFGLDRSQSVTLLPKSVTTAIGMDISAELGGLAALTSAMIILTGITGNLLASSVCRWFHITDPMAVGVGIGTSAHAVGTARALELGEVQGAMSGLAIAVAGVLTAVAAPLAVQFLP